VAMVAPGSILSRMKVSNEYAEQSKAKCKQHAHIQPMAGQKSIDTENTGTDR